MCLRELEKDHGLVQIYRQMMPVDLFQAQYGGWFSNLPWHMKSLMGFGILVVLAVISCGIYFAYLNWQGTGADKINKPRKKLTAGRTENKNSIGSKAKGAKAESSADASNESDSNSATTKKSGLKKMSDTKSPKNKQARGNPPQKPATKLEAASDKTGKAGQSKTDISKELIKTAENLEDIHDKIEESDKPVKGMEKLEKVKKAHDKLEKVKRELDKDN